jgi:hypothetical protein
MIQNILVALIVGAALFFIVRHFYLNFRKTAAGGCGCDSGCGCAGCNDTYTCNTFDKYFLEESCRDDSAKCQR